MKKTAFAALAVLCLLFAGCSSVCKIATRTLCVEPLLFPTQRDSHRTKKRDRQWAKAAWQAEMAANPEVCCSEEYKRGFKEGFADYLYAGGTGEPPPVPPRRLWNLDYRTAEGHKAVEDWFAGFRQGAHAVREAGYRNLVTAKSSLLTCNNFDVPVMPSGILEKLEPVEVIPTPQPAESVPKPRKPTLPSHESSSNTKKVVPNRGELEPQLRIPRPINREAVEPEFKSFVPAVDDAEPVTKMSEPQAMKPKAKAKEQISTSPATEDKEDSGVVMLPSCPSALLPESRCVSQLR